MGLLERILGEGARPARGATFARDARAMRATLDAMNAELAAVRSHEVDLRPLVVDLLEGEVEAPTEDVAALVREGVDPGDFYERELAPSWDGLGESERAARIDAFVEMCTSLEMPGVASDLPPEMARSIRTRTLLLAWAFDETYGYLSSLARTAGS